jgi:hypothetical protein
MVLEISPRLRVTDLSSNEPEEVKRDPSDAALPNSKDASIFEPTAGFLNRVRTD